MSNTPQTEKRASWPLVLARLSPLTLPLAVLFVGGLILAVGQSLGYWLPVPSDVVGAAAYAELFSSRIRAAWALSVWVGFASACISVWTGVALAWGIWRLPVWMQPLATVYKLPLILPHIAAGFIVVALFGQSGLVASFAHHLGWIHAPRDFPSILYDGYGAGMILAYTFKETPFVILLCLASLRRLDPQLETTAIMLGAGRWRRFRSIIVPHCTPVMHTSFLILFMYGFGGFDIPWLLAGSSPSMLAVEVYNLYFMRDLANRPTAMAILAAMFVFSLGCIVLYTRVANRMGRQSQIQRKERTL